MEIQRNRSKLLLASCLTIATAGVGFSVRAGLLRIWGDQFGFTQSELGTITGGGIVGIGLLLLFASQFTDRIGYKAMLSIGFWLHLLSVPLTLAATWVYEVAGKGATFQCLYWGMFLFSVGTGFTETAVNPLVADLYRERKTHYLNVLHAGWPAGLIVGGLAGKALIGNVRWEIPIVLYALPTLWYGFITFSNAFPKSDAAKAGISYGQMLKEFASPILLLLLLLQACVGYVELGTDSWISNITDSVLKGQGLYLLVYASSIMFVLRFFAGPIVERINPLGLLCASTVLGTTGLFMISKLETTGLLWLAVTVYALGKTFLWPTMLGVVGERFPRGGAVIMGAAGAAACLSAGFLGGPGIGYQQDAAAAAQLQTSAPESYARYTAPDENRFLFLPSVRGLDGQKVGVLLDSPPAQTLSSDFRIATARGEVPAALAGLKQWWDQTGAAHAKTDQPSVARARIHGGQVALAQTALVPAAMFLGYLFLVVYFRRRGGYQTLRIDAHAPSATTAEVEVPEPTSGAAVHLPSSS
jgi:fucose permease